MDILEMINSTTGQVLYCPNIGKALNFWPNSISHCCVAVGAKGIPNICEYKGNGFPLDIYLKSFKDYINMIASQTGPCMGCKYLMRGKPDVEFTQFRGVAFNNFNLCQLNCEYCKIESGSWRKEIIEKLYSVLAPIQELFALGLLAENVVVAWGGGEPTLYDYFPETSEFLINARIKQVMNTNAIIFSDEIAKGLSTGLMEVRVSVDSGTSESYSRIKGFDFFDKVWRNIQKYNAVSSHKIVGKYVVTSNNLGDSDIDGFVQKCLLNGIEEILVSVDAYTYLPVTNYEVSCAYVKAAKKLYQRATENGLLANPTYIYGEEDIKTIVGTK
jgi:sulfatase maturation enzyme AslB (radical SAM superfamily)